MATLTNINAAALKPSAAPTTNAIAAAADQFASAGGKYMVRFTNASATPANVVLDDPTSLTPSEATTFVPDVTMPVPAGEARTMFVDSARFRASDGFIKWTYSASMVNASSLVEIYGPIN